MHILYHYIISANAKPVARKHGLQLTDMPSGKLSHLVAPWDAMRD
jgi:hypothetical protein